MPVRVLVVDDSGFFRRRLSEILNADPGIEVVGTADNGEEAIEKTLHLRPDVITMDVEMPVMDGITAVRRIMSVRPTPILMFSSLTTDGAQATLDALDAGAVDFLPKKFEDISRDREEARHLLTSTVHIVARSTAGRRTTRPRTERPVSATPATEAGVPASKAKKGNYGLVAIGTSTGGPVALQQVLTALPANFSLPLLLIQHMPASFTPAFAQRLDQLCAIKVREAVDGDLLTPGTALLAPGGKQMIVEGSGGRARVRIADGDPGLIYRPSVDVTYTSLAQAMPGKVLAVVLTGMGADGREGARLLKQGGSTIWAQDQQSCVVYGMPAAVAEAGLTERVLPLQQIGRQIAEAIG